MPGVVLSELRRRLRKLMQPDIGLADETRSQYQWLAPFVDATRAVGRSLIATLGHAFSVFLTPRHDLDLEALSAVENIEIHFRDQRVGNGWTISRLGQSGAPSEAPASCCFPLDIAHPPSRRRLSKEIVGRGRDGLAETRRAEQPALDSSADSGPIRNN